VTVSLQGPNVTAAAATAPAVIRRTINADFLNSVANRADVRPWLGTGTEAIDLQPVLTDVGNIALVTEYGGCVFHQTEPAIYELYSFFLTEGRGGHECAAVRAAVANVFTGTNAIEIGTKLPVNNAAPLDVARLAGFHHRFTMNGLSVYGLTWDEWVLTANETHQAGADFHQRFHAVKLEHGASSPDHEDDPVHNRFAGFCALCVYAGNAAKGVRLYNRWARLAGYAQIALLSEHPMVIDIVDAVISVGPQQAWEVLSCQ
jgi:hypothetical protein